MTSRPESVHFVQLDVSELSNQEIGIRLIAMGDDFPFSGDNYDQAILEEALKRIKLINERG